MAGATKGAAAAKTHHDPDVVAILTDGTSVCVPDPRCAELRDPAGRLLLRYRDGGLELAPEQGDLVLRAPAGRVRLEAVSPDGDERCQLELGAGRAALRTGHLEVEARSSRLVTGAATVLARELSTTAVHLVQKVERYELDATRIVERARDTFREVQGLAQQHVGRLRTLVRDVYSVDARRTYLRSKDDTAIDGKRVLLG